MLRTFNSSKFSGFLPVRKPKNICCNKILLSMQEEYTFANRSDVKRHQIFSNIAYARYLEPFSSGLMTFIFGACNNYRRNFVLSEYKYRFTIEFGVERHFGSVDGNIISKQDTSHICREFVEDQLKEFTRLKLQTRLNNYSLSDPNQASSSLPLTPSQTIYRSMQFSRELTNTPSKPQKYPKLEMTKEVECYGINILECDRHFATLELSCQGSFSPRRFMLDFAKFIDTKASLVELERLYEGIMSLNDLRVLDLYQTQYDFYKTRVPSFRTEYISYLSQFDHHFLKDD